MRRVYLDEKLIGLRLGKPIIGINGHMLLGKGTELTKHFIKRLKSLGYTQVYVEDGLIDDSTPDELISNATRVQIASSISEITANFRLTNKLNVIKFNNVMHTILTNVLNNKRMLASLTDIRTSDPNDFLFNHSINVSALSVLIGIHLYYSDQKLFELGMGVLLHDIGKVALPDKFLSVSFNELTSEEQEIYRQHTWNGYHILRANPEIKLVSAAIALQHHERFDGSGYPRSLKGTSILEYARIASIADTYDNLSNDKGTFKRLPAHKVYQYLQSRSGIDYDPKILDRFIQKIALYPQGTKIILNNKKSGFVLRQNNSNNSRPVVRLFWLEDKELAQPEEVDLLREPSLCIEKVVE